MAEAGSGRGRAARSAQTGRRAVLALLQAMSLTQIARHAVRRWRAWGVPRVKPDVMRVLPHDPTAFTQGLCYWSEHLYESTGLMGASSVRCIDPASGALLRFVPVEGVWGEGLAVMGHRLVQLTYTSGVANIFVLPDLQRSGIYRYSGEGWGLATCADRFIMTNGSDVIFFRDEQFAVVRRLPVTIGTARLRGLNDLEFAVGRIYANAYYDNSIYEISPDDGRITRVVDCSDLVRIESRGHRHRILNGIAYAPDRGTFFLTGKRWARIYEVTIQPRVRSSPALTPPPRESSVVGQGPPP